MDDIDDLFDLTDPEGLTFATSSGLLEDETACRCTCGCTRPAEWRGDECDACREGRHFDPFDPDDRRRR